MTVLRSREVIKTLNSPEAKPSQPSSSPPHPSTPSISDTTPKPSPSIFPGLGSGVVPDLNGPSLPRRRSLRIASISAAAVPSQSDAKKLGGEPVVGVSDIDGKFFGHSPKKSSCRKRVNENYEEKEASACMSLRSGSRIARRRLEVVSNDSNQLGKDKLENDSDGDSGGAGGGGAEDKEEMDGVGKRGFTDEEKGKAKSVAEEDGILIDRNTIVMDRTQKTTREMGCVGRRKFSKEEKGKGKSVVEEGFLSIDGLTQVQIDEIIDALDDAEEHSQNREEPIKKRKSSRVKVPNVSEVQSESRRAADRSKAIELAPKFALFKPEAEDEEKGEDDDEGLLDEIELDREDWPGPFSTAMKIIEEREERLMARESNTASKTVECYEIKIQWNPSVDRKRRPLGRSPPSLKDLCLKVLCENAEEIESLDGVPDAVKHRLISMLCSSRKMSSCLLGRLFCEAPSEIRLNDCSWATEKQFEEALAGCKTDNLKVVQLDLSGRCLPDYVLRATLAHSPNCLPLLTTISLRGAYRLSDDGLNAIVSSAPFLNSVNLCQCSLITSNGVISLADKLGSVLKELYLDDCQSVDAMLILPALKNLRCLEVLSMAGIETVCDKFVRKLIPVCGAKLKELGFACCRKLSGASMKIIGENCSQLQAIDLRNLHRLNDSAIGNLANSCRAIQTLKLQHNLFSDEAIAAFLEASGGSLVELSLNSVEKVAQHTAVAISRRCSSTLQSLDLSFCRKMTNEALGLIVDNCSYLRIVKLFGCTQVTNVFLDGHSNSLVKIIGLNGPVLEFVEMSDFL